MNRDYKFKEGQRVKIDDWEDGIVHGSVTDTTASSVFILWDGLTMPAQYSQSEYEDIKLSKKLKKNA